MKDIYYIYEYINFLLNKESYWKSPSEVMEVLHHAQMGYVMDKIGNPAKYQVGHPIPPVSYQITKMVSEHLRPLVKGETIPVTNGSFFVPQDFLYPTSLRLSKNGGKVDIVDDDKVSDRLASKIRIVDKDHPIVEISGNGYTVHPSTGVPSVYLKYLKIPPKPVYSTDILGDNEVYNDSKSVDLVWNGMAKEEIIARALQALGLNVKDGTVLNFGQYKTQQGG